MPSPSRNRVGTGAAGRSAGRLLSVGVLGMVLLPGVLGLVRSAGTIIVPAGDTIAEDLYAFGSRVIVEGRVEGDVFALTGDLVVVGTVTGDVVGFAGTRVRVAGTVEGSVRVVTPSLLVSGRVGDDVAALAGSAVVTGEVGRDLLLVSGSAEIAGATARDVRSQAWRMAMGGAVGRDALVKADRLSIGPGVRVAGDIVYRSPVAANVDPSAEMGGRLVRARTFTPVWARAVERAVQVVGLLGTILAGLALGWLFRGTSARTVAAAGGEPWRNAAVGLVLLVVPPLAVIPLSLTLVGLPLALLVAILWLLALFLGALPTLVWVGGRLLRGRGGLAAALVAGAVVWRAAMWALPLAAVLIYLTATILGLGALGRAAWGARDQAVPAS